MDSIRPQKLFVYECFGPRLPRSEPDCSGFAGIWPEGSFYYLFFIREAGDQLNLWLRDQQGWYLRNTYQIDYEDWQQVPLSDQKVGPFLIRTAMDTGSESDAPGVKLIRLNPGVVFGSGLHPTTKGCLLALADTYAKFPIKSATDFGTGTGILALACAGLGVPKILAVDCNPLAIRVAHKNAVYNGFENKIDFAVTRELNVLKIPSDLLLMNIEWPCLKEAIQCDDWLRYKLVILSGFLMSQWNELEDLFPSKYEILYREVLDDWITVVLDNCSK